MPHLRDALTALALGLGMLAIPGGVASADPPPAAESPGVRAILAGEEAASGTTVPELGEAPAAGLAGRPIRRVEVVTVGGRWAASPTLRAVRAGEPASPDAARRAMRELLETGRFARANVEAIPEGDGVLLRVNVLPRRLVASVQVTGGALDNAAMLEAADVADGAEITAPMLSTIAARIERYYAQHGFAAAKVTVDASDTDDPGRVVLSIEIKPGPPRAVTERVFVIDPVVDREVGSLKQGYRVGKGARVEEGQLDDADRELGETLRQKGFLRAEVRHATRVVGPYTYLYVYVNAGPRLRPAFDGNRAFDADQLTEALDLVKAPDARPGELVDRLRTFYVMRGFYDVEVEVKERGGPDEAVHWLAFTVREHRQVRVARRVFPCLGEDVKPDEMGREINSFLEEELPGAETFSLPDPRVVTGLFGPTQGSGGRAVPVDLNPSATYAPETYDRAIKHLRDLLHSRGYMNAVVGPVAVLRPTCSKRSPPGQCIPVPPKQPLAARCLRDSLGLPLPEPPVPEGLTCRPDPSRDVECSPEIELRIPIALGPRTALYDLAFEGNRSQTEAELGKVADLALGGPLSNVDLEAARVRVLDSYRLRGFAYAEVRAALELSPDRSRARVRFQITERDKVMVSDFVIKGATRTDKSLILRRLALRKNAPFRQDWARQSEERIATLGTFSSVSVGLEDADIPQRQKRVVVTVVEQQPQYIETRIGFSTGEGLRFAFEYGHRNIGGLAIALTLRVQLGYLFEFLVLDPAYQENFSKLTVLERLKRRNQATITFPEIGLGPLVSLSLDGIDVRDNQRDYTLQKEAFAPSVTYRPLRQLTTQVGVSAELNDVAIFDEQVLRDNQVLLSVPQGRTVALAQRVNFTADYRDNAFNPTRGVLFSTGLEHVDAFPAGIEGNLAKDTSHFLRFTGKIAGYIRLTQKGMAIAMSLAGGYNLQLTKDSKTYPDRLFFLGGVDSLRAFLANTVVPEDIAQKILTGAHKPGTSSPYTIEDVAIRGGDVALNPRLELRVPLTDVFQTGLFLDMGNLWVDPSTMNPFILRYALGAGLRINTPIGPLALDYGFNLLRRPWEDIGAFHFAIGLF